MSFVQKKRILLPGNTLRKGGYQKENQAPSFKSDYDELRDEISDTTSVTAEMPAVFKRRVIYENNYKMSPDKLFPVKQVERIILEVLEENLAKKKYDFNRSIELCKIVSQIIKDKVKGLKVSRYKLVIIVHIGECAGQDVKIASQCLWNQEFDTYATASLRNQSLFAQGTVFGIYFE
ncbi:hypothetical protein QZH41_004813 [Actinostola sp. cb2023]|nr:hypothetical protein QZH41_004813 [Actinostola sp. cb2023]